MSGREFMAMRTTHGFAPADDEALEQVKRIKVGQVCRVVVRVVRKRLLVEMQRIRDDADDRISTLRAEAKQLTLESVARKFECSITQIHHIIGES